MLAQILPNIRLIKIERKDFQTFQGPASINCQLHSFDFLVTAWSQFPVICVNQLINLFVFHKHPQIGKNLKP